MYAQIPTVEPEYKCKMPLFELGEVEKIRARFSDFWSTLFADRTHAILT